MLKKALQLYATAVNLLRDPQPAKSPIHGIVSMMPFTDGNGRLARLVTHLAARELLGPGVAVDLTTDRTASSAS